MPPKKKNRNKGRNAQQNVEEVRENIPHQPIRQEEPRQAQVLTFRDPSEREQPQGATSQQFYRDQQQSGGDGRSYRQDNRGQQFSGKKGPYKQQQYGGKYDGDNLNQQYGQPNQPQPYQQQPYQQPYRAKRGPQNQQQHFSAEQSSGDQQHRPVSGNKGQYMQQHQERDEADTYKKFKEGQQARSEQQYMEKRKQNVSEHQQSEGYGRGSRFDPTTQQQPYTEKKDIHSKSFQGLEENPPKIEQSKNVIDSQQTTAKSQPQKTFVESTIRKEPSKIKPDVPQNEPEICKELGKLEISEDTPSTESPTTTDEVVSTSETEKKLNKKQYIKLNLNYKVAETVQQKFLPKRPDAGGRDGRQIKLIINCCDVKLNSNMKIFMYDIELKDAKYVGNKKDAKQKASKKENLRKIVDKYLSGLKGIVPVFDGQKIIFSNRDLPIDNTVNRVKIVAEIDGDEIECLFDLQRVKEDTMTFGNLTHYVESKQGRSDAMPQEILRALDTTIREMFLRKELLYLGGRAIFNAVRPHTLKCGPYVLYEGYNYSFRPHQWSIRFNFDKTQVVCHEAMPLIKYLDCLRWDPNRAFNVEKKIKMLRVQSNHLKKSNGGTYIRKYTIFGFTKTNAKTEVIKDKKINIEQYFKSEYSISLKYSNYPLIKVNKTGSCIPIELLEVLPNQKILGNDPSIVQEVIRKAAIPAAERLAILRQAIKDLGLANRMDRYLKDYMIQIDDKLINTMGRVLEGPKVSFGGAEENLRGGKWDMRRKKFHKPFQSPINWAFFALGRENDYRDQRPLFEVEEKLPINARQVGLSMNDNFRFEFVPYQNFEKTVTNVRQDAKKKGKELNMILCVINNSSEYQAIKQCGDISLGIVTQCLNMRTLVRQKNMDQYLGNVLLKINGKLGGTNWSMPLERLFVPIIKDQFMVFGVDVTHPSATRNDLSQSVAAIVGSVDHTASQYAAIIRKQISKSDRAIIEVIIDKEIMVHNLLMTFYKSNNQLKPRHLIFYRDGVSEGQFEIVFRHEIIAIQNACSRLDPDYQPKITYIVVQKRHKIRFFPENQKDAVGRSGNVPAGTVVDTDITHCREFDFYLCSHEGIQGTSKPAHYHVLYDENNWTSDKLQSFTFYLCHIYARCTRSVSYPAPTYYAHLAAFRGRALIGDPGGDDAASVTSHASSNSQPIDNTPEININGYHSTKLFFL